MAHKINSFERFWKELKRRKVVHVITVYAAVAFVILQVTNMVVQPLRLPDWTEAFVIFLLCIGFVISVFVSWVFDITPAGVKKTKPVSTVKHVDQTTTVASSGWKIATYVSAAIIIGLIVFNIISRRNLNTDISKLEKSIAVLPFIVGQHQEAYMAAQKRIEQFKKSGDLPLFESHRFGYSFWGVGKFKEADYYFKEQIKYDTKSIKLGRGMGSIKSAQYDLAATYAFLGNKTKAYQYLDDYNTMNVYPLWWVSLAKHDPLFANIRNEERFQKILQNMEAKYQAEHERVRKWIEEQGQL